MAEYKVSYKLLAQQAEELLKISSQLNTYNEQLAAIVPKLGEGELLATAKSNINAMASQMGEGAELTSIAGNMLKETIDEYSNVEVKLTQQAEGTRAHSRDFYKNPVSVGSAIGSDASTATPLNTVDGPMESYAPPGGYGDTYPSSAGAQGASAGVSGAAASTGMGAGAAVAGAAVAGAAVGAGALFAAKKAKGKKAAGQDGKAQNESGQQSAVSSATQSGEDFQKDSYEIELALKKAKEKLENLE